MLVVQALLVALAYTLLGLVGFGAGEVHPEIILLLSLPITFREKTLIIVISVVHGQGIFHLIPDIARFRKAGIILIGLVGVIVILHLALLDLSGSLQTHPFHFYGSIVA